jgi:hypothetical protein
MALTIDQRKRLLEALNDVFTAKDAVEDLAQGARDRTLAQISLADNLPAILGAMVDAAREEGWLGRLLDEAVVLRPNSEELAQLRDELREEIIAERMDHFAACRLLGHNYMVDRAPLRLKLQHLAAREEGIHILKVRGPSKSGKSHTFQLIRYLADRVGGFKMVFVDLAELSSAVGRDLLPEDLGEEIVFQMKLEGQMPVRQNELDSRWVRRFVAWLTGELQNGDGGYWIVLDSFGNTLVPDGVYELVRRLAEQIETNLSQMRLVLLGFDRDLPDRVLGGLEEEDLTAAARIGQDQLLDFFSRMYQERRLRRAADFAAADVAGSVSTVMQKVAFDRDDYLLQLGKAVMEEGRRIWSLGGGS